MTGYIGVRNLPNTTAPMRDRPLLPGTILRRDYLVEFLFAGPAGTRQVVTAAVGTVVNNTNYSVTALGATVTVASASLANTAVRDALVLAMQQNPVFGSKFTIAAGSGNSFTLTNNEIGGVIGVTVAGGNLAISSNSLPTTPVPSLPLGRILVQSGIDTTLNNAVIGALPSATGQNVLGLGPVLEDNSEYLRDPYGDPISGLPILSFGTAVRRGEVVALSETAFTGNETRIFYRHTANGALGNLGAIAAATGTGLDELTTAKPVGPSQALGDGTFAVPIAINLI